MDIFPAPQIIIERVIDGDTIELSEPLFGVTKVRLDGIDTPETRTASCRRERNLGYEAKGYARALLEGRVVEIYTTGKKGKWGRLIARIGVDGEDYGQTMLEQGYAVRYSKEWIATPKDERWC
ncbi:thermonuclease family protein [Litorimonas haliclonae]|uniref:thermonuclease family protein n=1 Tax=Litorimonas haliclonae TaxID=2081977 RepID=UPI0039EF316C